MTTTADIINRAFSKVGVASEDEALTAYQQAQGLDALNMMLAGWAIQGIDADLPELAVMDEFPLPPKFHEAIVYMLAGRIAPDFTVPVGFDPDDWFRTIQAHYMQINESKMPATMLRTSSQRRRLR